MQRTHLIIADNDITRLGLHTLIRSALTDMEDLKVEEAGQRSELIELLKAQPAPVVIIDCTLFDLGSSDALVELSAHFPQAMWVLFSSDLTESFIRRISMEQCFSMVYKDDSSNEIVTAIRCAIAGDRFLCHQVTNLLLAHQPQKSILDRDGLTSTEIEVLRLIAYGKSVKEIAAERNSSVHTITTHKKNIFRKINVNTIYEATKYALRAGLLEMVGYCI